MQQRRYTNTLWDRFAGKTLFTQGSSALGEATPSDEVVVALYYAEDVYFYPIRVLGVDLAGSAALGALGDAEQHDSWVDNLLWGTDEEENRENPSA